MVALLIAVLAGASLLWSSAADAHSLKPVLPAGASVPGGATVPSEAQVQASATDHGLLILLVLLAAAAGAPLLAGRLRRQTLALAAAILLVVLLGGSAPHLVHHAFETGKGAECQILQVASHADGAGGSPDALPMVFASVRIDSDLGLPVGSAPAPALRPRAPPA
jgi:hypothetical protein